MDVLSETWWYPLQYGDTLSNHEWIPLYINRLMASDFVAHAIADGRRGDIGTALLLWVGSFKEDPAGTLPDDDVRLAQIAGFGPDVAGWRAVRPGALYGFVPVEISGAAPGRKRRLAHPVIAEIAHDMHRRKKGRDQAREASRLSSLRNRVRIKLKAMGWPQSTWESRTVVEAVSIFLDQANLYCTDENVSVAMQEAVGIPREVPRINGLRGSPGGV